MRTLIIEDESLLAKHLSKLIRHLRTDWMVAATCNSVASSVQWLSENAKPDVIFMDIELADGQSFEIFNRIDVTSPIIFTTAYDEYALNAFKVNSVDYLLKPILEADLRRAIEKLERLQGSDAIENIQRLLNQVNKNSSADYRDRMLVKKGQKMIPIQMSEVAMFFTQNTVNHLITTSGQKHLVNYTLDELEQTLDPKVFFRANRQIIISHHIITTVHSWFNGKLKLDIKIPLDEPVLISREKAPEFRAWLGE